MDNKHCINCYYCDKCQCDKVCEYYTPIDEPPIDDIIEQNRKEFHREWFRYIKAWNS